MAREWRDYFLQCRKSAAAAITCCEAGIQSCGGERGAHCVQRSHGGCGQPSAEAGEEWEGTGRDRAKAAATRRKNRWDVILKAVLTGVQDTETFKVDKSIWVTFVTSILFTLSARL